MHNLLAACIYTLLKFTICLFLSLHQFLSWLLTLYLSVPWIFPCLHFFLSFYSSPPFFYTSPIFRHVFLPLSAQNSTKINIIFLSISISVHLFVHLQMSILLSLWLSPPFSLHIFPFLKDNPKHSFQKSYNHSGRACACSLACQRCIVYQHRFFPSIYFSNN